MLKRFGLAACLLFISTPALAQTTTYSGTLIYTPYMGVGFGGYIGESGTYKINWNIDANIVAHLDVNLFFRTYDYDADGNPSGGNEWFTYIISKDTGPIGNEIVYIPDDGVDYYPDGSYTIYTGYTSGFGMEINDVYNTLTIGQRINYIFTVTRLGAGPGPGGVPEATTWAMMLAGFGLAGGAMRLRRTKIAFAAA